MPDISIIICTYNRATDLNDTLNSFLRLDTTGISYELIIVDNNSDDLTSNVIDSFKCKIPCLKAIKEFSQGLSFARNRGISESSADIVAFLDDDVEIHIDWLKSITKPFDDKEVWCVGGKVLPFDVSILPFWLPKRLTFVLSLADFGNVDKYLNGKEKPVGCNIAYRKIAFDTTGMFDTNLGRIGKQLLGGEEVLIYYLILAAGKKIVYCSNAVVNHKISSKVNKQYVYDFAYWLGVSESYIELKYNKKRFMLKYIRSFLGSYTFYPIFIYCYKFIKCEEYSIVYLNYISNYSLGYIKRDRNT